MGPLKIPYLGLFEIWIGFDLYFEVLGVILNVPKLLKIVSFSFYLTACQKQYQ